MLKPPLQPMLLSTKNEPFDSKDYLFEFKWDGFRCLPFIRNNKLFLQSRNGKNLTPHFPELNQIVNLINTDNAVLDGEICYFSSEGRSQFNIIQKRFHSKDNTHLSKKYPTTLIIWDLLSFDQEEIYMQELTKRKKLLNNIINSTSSPFLQLSPYLLEQGNKLYKQAEANGLEGIVAKQINSPYEFKRSEKWKKIKIWKYTTVNIGGFTNDREGLLVGKFITYDDNNSKEKIDDLKKRNNKQKLNYMGKIKLALSREEKIALFNFLPRIEIDNSSFDQTPKKKGITWVKPVIKCDIKYTEYTVNNTFRHGHAIKLNLK